MGFFYIYFYTFRTMTYRNRIFVVHSFFFVIKKEFEIRWLLACMLIAPTFVCFLRNLCGTKGRHEKQTFPAEIVLRQTMQTNI